MPEGTRQMISAVVLLYSQTGTMPSGHAAITADTLHEYQPDPQSVLNAQARFRSLGFQVSPLVGISFSITAPQSVFGQVFQVTLRYNDQGGLEVVKENRLAGYELPVEHLPQELQTLVYAVTFTPPPDFGPSNF
jgi:hypothetical protein